MSDAKQITEVIANGDFERWLSASGAKLDCIQCGAEEWSVMVGENESAGLVIIHDDNIDLTRFVPMIALVCGKCGYIRSHAMRHLLNWLDKEKEAADARNADPQ